jgi:predicted enzyme related to lactoylglutathione lyase
MNILINIDVPDLVPAIDFYCNAFGLKLNRLLDDDVAELTGASSTIYLLQNTEGSSCSEYSTETRRYKRHWTPVHFDMVVTDIGQATERAVRAGATIETECNEWRGAKCITFSDPFGHGFCLIEFEEASYR